MIYHFDVLVLEELGRVIIGEVQEVHQHLVWDAQEFVNQDILLTWIRLTADHPSNAFIDHVLLVVLQVLACLWDLSDECVDIWLLFLLVPFYELFFG